MNKKSFYYTILLFCSYLIISNTAYAAKRKSNKLQSYKIKNNAEKKFQIGVCEITLPKIYDELDKKFLINVYDRVAVQCYFHSEKKQREKIKNNLKKTNQKLEQILKYIDFLYFMQKRIFTSKENTIVQDEHSIAMEYYKCLEAWEEIDHSSSKLIRKPMIFNILKRSGIFNKVADNELNKVLDKILSNISDKKLDSKILSQFLVACFSCDNSQKLL